MHHQYRLYFLKLIFLLGLFVGAASIVQAKQPSPYQNDALVKSTECHVVKSQPCGVCQDIFLGRNTDEDDILALCDLYQLTDQVCILSKFKFDNFYNTHFDPSRLFSPNSIVETYS